MTQKRYLKNTIEDNLPELRRLFERTIDETLNDAGAFSYDVEIRRGKYSLDDDGDSEYTIKVSAKVGIYDSSKLQQANTPAPVELTGLTVEAAAMKEAYEAFAPTPADLSFANLLPFPATGEGTVTFDILKTPFREPDPFRTSLPVRSSSGLKFFGPGSVSIQDAATGDWKLLGYTTGPVTITSELVELNPAAITSAIKGEIVAELQAESKSVIEETYGGFSGMPKLIFPDQPVDAALYTPQHGDIRFKGDGKTREVWIERGGVGKWTPPAAWRAGEDCTCRYCMAFDVLAKKDEADKKAAEFEVELNRKGRHGEIRNLYGYDEVWIGETSPFNDPGWKIPASEGYYMEGCFCGNCKAARFIKAKAEEAKREAEAAAEEAAAAAELERLKAENDAFDAYVATLPRRDNGIFPSSYVQYGWRGFNPICNCFGCVQARQRCRAEWDANRADLAKRVEEFNTASFQTGPPQPPKDLDHGKIPAADWDRLQVKAQNVEYDLSSQIVATETVFNDGARCVQKFGFDGTLFDTQYEPAPVRWPSWSRQFRGYGGGYGKTYAAELATQAYLDEREVRLAVDELMARYGSPWGGRGTWAQNKADRERYEARQDAWNASRDAWNARQRLGDDVATLKRWGAANRAKNEEAARAAKVAHVVLDRAIRDNTVEAVELYKALRLKPFEC